MRIHEIKFNPRTSTKAISGVIHSDKVEYIANGCQAIAYYHKTHPNTVIKVAAVSGPADPIWQFLRICVNHQNNPYFPKVFNHKIFNLKGLTAAEIEYLESLTEYLPIHDNRKMQILIITERLEEVSPWQFSIYCEYELGLGGLFNAYKSKYQRTTKTPLTPELIWQNMMDKEAGRKMLRKYTTDKNFADAIRLLSPLLNSGKMYADVGLHNMMFRNNGQLVFNDPLAIVIDD